MGDTELLAGIPKRNIEIVEVISQRSLKYGRKEGTRRNKYGDGCRVIV